MTSKIHCFVFSLSVFIPSLTEKSRAQDEEPGGLPPVLRACDEKGNYLRHGNGRDRIGTLAWIDGWTLERKLESPDSHPADAIGSPARE